MVSVTLFFLLKNSFEFTTLLVLQKKIAFKVLIKSWQETFSSSSSSFLTTHSFFENRCDKWMECLYGIIKLSPFFSLLHSLLSYHYSYLLLALLSSYYNLLIFGRLKDDWSDFVVIVAVDVVKWQIWNLWSEGSLLPHKKYFSIRNDTPATTTENALCNFGLSYICRG